MENLQNEEIRKIGKVCKIGKMRKLEDAVIGKGKKIRQMGKQKTCETRKKENRKYS